METESSLLEPSRPIAEMEKQKEGTSKLERSSNGCAGDNVELLLEVEVTESLYAAMSREQGSSIEQSGLVEVTIIRPITADPFTFTPHSVKTLSTIDECESVPSKRHRQKPYRRPTTTMERHRQYNPGNCQTNNNFISDMVENRGEVNVEEIGDLPREFMRKSKTRTKVRTKPPCAVAMGTQSGDHCYLDDIKTNAPSPDRHSAAVGFIKSYIKACNSKSEIREAGYRNTTLVYQVKQENAKGLDPPLVELGTVYKILEQSKEGEFPKCDSSKEVVGKLQKLVADWASDEKNVHDFLSNDTSLTRCEHCGVISCLKVSKTSACLPVKIKKSQQLLKYRYGHGLLQNSKLDATYDANKLKTNGQVEREDRDSNEYFSCASPRKFSENRMKDDSFEPPENVIDTETRSDTELRNSTLQNECISTLLNIIQPCIETIHPPALDTMTAERESDSASDNIKQLGFISKDEVESPILPTVHLNQCNTIDTITPIDRKDNGCSDAIYRTSHTPRVKSKRTSSQTEKKMMPSTSQERREKSNTRSNNKMKPQEKPTNKVVKDGKLPASKMRVEKDVQKRNQCQPNVQIKRPVIKCKEEEKWKNSLRKEIPRKEKSKIIVDKITVLPNNLSKPETTVPIQLTPLTDTVNYLAQGQFAPVQGKGKHSLQEFDEKLYVPWKKKQSFAIHGSHDDEPQSESGLWLWENQKSLAESIAEHLNRNPSMSNEEKISHNILSNSSEDKSYSGYENDNKCVKEDKDLQWSIMEEYGNTFKEGSAKKRETSIGSVQECFFRKENSNDQHLEDSNSEYCNEESGQLPGSETTGLSSSSAEKMIREWTKPSVDDSDCNSKSPTFEKDTDKASFDVIRDIRTQITEAIERCTNYSVISEDKLYNHKKSAESRISYQLDQSNEVRKWNTETEYIDYIIKQYEQLKETNWHDILDTGVLHATPADAACKLENTTLRIAHEIESDKKKKRMKINDNTLSNSVEDYKTSSSSEKYSTVVKNVDDSNVLNCRNENSKTIEKSVKSDLDTERTEAELKIIREYNDRYSHGLDKDTFQMVKEVADTIWGEHTTKVASLKISDKKSSMDDYGSDERSLTKQQYIIISAPTTSADSPKSSFKMTYKNPASVLSSSSAENSIESQRRLYLPENSASNSNICDDLQADESERFERQITYEDMSSRDISTGSRDEDDAKVLPIYRKILESNDEMDWESFQQLVQTLHPSQRELWCDICKAVSNEAKRVAGETGASTEVCIEINPVPPGQVFPKEEKGKLRTCGDEISFEMDMILKDVETFLDKKLGTAIDNPKTYRDRGNQNYGR